MGKKSTI